MSYIAPAGTAIAPHTVAVSLLRGATHRGAYRNLQSALALHSGHDRAFLMSTGRAAMTLALRAMRELAPQRTDVLMPAYTCYSVPAAVKLAGLRPRLVDIDPATLSPSPSALEAIDTSRSLAIVSANLYGLPNDLTTLAGFARARGIYLLDDAAQALGATLAGRPVGGFGDAGLYSFDKGKNITSIEGGALVASGALGDTLARHQASLPAPRTARTAITAAKLLVYSLMLRPVAYGLMNRLPLGLGATPWEDDFPVSNYSPTLAGMTWRLFGSLEHLTRMRTTNAARLSDALADAPGVSLPRIVPGANPAWARYPMFLDPVRRERAVAALQAAGIGATLSYPRALCDVPQVVELLASDQAPLPGARAVAERIVTLPTHAYVPGDLGERVRTILQAV